MPFLWYPWYVAGFRASFWFPVSFPRASQASDRREGGGSLQAGLCPTTAVDFACRPVLVFKHDSVREGVVLYDLGSVFVPGMRTSVFIKQAPKVPCCSGCAVCANLLVMEDELVCALCKGAENAANNITQQKLVVNNKCGHRL